MLSKKIRANRYTVLNKIVDENEFINIVADFKTHINSYVKNS